MPRRTKTARKINLAVETPRDKFIRIGKYRVNRAIYAIRLIGNLSAAPYQWTNEDAVNIKSAILMALNETMTKFEKNKRPQNYEKFDFTATG